LDIFHVTLSSGISGSINSAQIARDELVTKYPDRKIIVEDSLAASAGYGLLMDKLAELKKSGYSMVELQEWLVGHRLKMNHWFFSSDLTFYIKGGRVSKVSGFVGSVLNICPLLNVNFEGKLIPRYKIRSKKKAVEAIVKKMVELAEGRENYSGKCFISQSACFDDAKAVADLVEKNFPKLDGRVVINDIGTTIGSHTGPGTVALFFWGDERVD
jgi:DegV family protein with EDD domain